MAKPPKNLAEFKKKLLALRTDLTRQIKELERPPEMGSDVDHFEEEADEAREFGVNLGIGELLRRRLDRVEEALRKIAKGVYGRCERCGGEIGPEVLRADPESELCGGCKARS